MLFNKIVDNGRDLPPLCSSMQQSNSFVFAKNCNSLSFSGPHLHYIHESSRPEWHLCALLKMISLYGDSCRCSEVRDWYLWPSESGWGVEEEEQNVWQAFGKWKKRGVKKVQHASFSLSLCSHRPSDGQGPQIQWVKCVPFQSPLHCNFPPGLPCSLLSLTEKCLPASISRSLYLSLALPSTYLAVHNSTGISKTCFSTTESIATALQQHLCTNV